MLTEQLGVDRARRPPPLAGRYEDSEGFAAAQQMIAQPLPKLILLGLIAGLEFHIFAGLKHILMDFHLGDSVAAAAHRTLVPCGSVLACALRRVAWRCLRQKGAGRARGRGRRSTCGV